MLQNPGWDWTVMSLCRADDRDRSVKFQEVCQCLGAQGIITDLDDSSPLKPVDPPREIGWRIRHHLVGRDWNLVVTHGRNGEYGHQRHMEVNGEVLRLATSGVLVCRELWTFAYVCDAQTGHCIASQGCDIRLPLTEQQLRQKHRIVREMYGYGQDSFEVRACISPEGFHRRLIGQGGQRQ